MAVGLRGQPVDSMKLVAPERGLRVNGLFQLRYCEELEGGAAGVPGEASSREALQLRRARVKLKGVLDQRWSAFAMVDLAHFVQTPAGMGLELAWLRYRHGEGLTVTAGLHRPYFGIEDQYIGDVMETIDWSLQYGAFGRRGWQSFHYGISVQGRLKSAPLPLSYAIGLYHHRKMPIGPDGGNYLYSRLAFDLAGGWSVGVNGAAGRTYGQTGDAWGVDLRWKHALGSRWEAHLEAEYKEGANMSRFCEQYRADPEKARIGGCRMRGLLLLPNVRYRLGASWLEAVAFSMRTEWFDDLLASEGGARLIYTPHLSIEWAADYALRLQLALIHDRGQDTGAQSSNRLLTQLQVRF